MNQNVEWWNHEKNKLKNIKKQSTSKTKWGCQKPARMIMLTW